MIVEIKTEKIMTVVDREGAAMTLEQWIELLQSIRSQCDTRIAAAREDQRKQKK